MDQGARFPEVGARGGHYESFYIKACQPGGGRGIWIRHTVHKRPGTDPTASIWFAWFDREGDGPRATKVTFPAAGLSTPVGAWLRIGEAEIGPGRAGGSIHTDALEASWQLRFDGDAAPCRYLPWDRLYETRLPKTKFVAPYPDARFDGTLALDGEQVEIAGWPGMVGHNWGSEHAERWVWLEGTGFAAAPDTYFDAGAARIKLGPWTSPWVPSGMLILEGEQHRLGGLRQVRAATIDASPGGCAFVLPGRDVTVRGRVSGPAKDFVGWVYADPKGPEHNTINCSVADLDLEIERPGRAPRRLNLQGGGAYELGMRETDHGVPIQPYPDG
jgi:hypothetical protein